MKIAIDVGHANGTGARGNGLEEHSISNSISSHLYYSLKSYGHSVDIIDFPEKSNSEDLNSTIKQANKGDYDFGVSIHCDCSDNPQAHGAHVCYYSSNGKKLADAIADSLCPFLEGRSEKTVKRTNLGVLKQTNSVWALIECGFISNKHDSEVMRNSPDEIADRIAEGIQKYCSVQ